MPVERTVMVLALGLAAGCAAQPPAGPAGGSGGAAPEIKAGYWLNSDPLTLDGLKGQVVVLEFWATWCPPCRVSIPHLIQLHKEYKDKGVVFVSLTDEPRGTVEPFAKEMGMGYAIGGDSSSSEAYGVRGIPTAFIISRQGQVAWEGHPMMGLDAALKAEVEKAADQ
jgi:thiol-disulfide isomerase/thioredoxin